MTVINRYIYIHIDASLAVIINRPWMWNKFHMIGLQDHLVSSNKSDSMSRDFINSVSLSLAHINQCELKKVCVCLLTNTSKILSHNPPEFMLMC